MTGLRNPIYLDYNATIPVDPAVLEAMLPYLKDHFGNPSSGHIYGIDRQSEYVRFRLRIHCDVFDNMTLANNSVVREQ